MVSLYRDGLLPENRVEDYVWSTILDSAFLSSVATSDSARRAAQQLTNSQITQAQLLAHELRDFTNTPTTEKVILAAIETLNPQH